MINTCFCSPINIKDNLSRIKQKTIFLVKFLLSLVKSQRKNYHNLRTKLISSRWIVNNSKCTWSSFQIQRLYLEVIKLWVQIKVHPIAVYSLLEGNLWLKFRSFAFGTVPGFYCVYHGKLPFWTTAITDVFSYRTENIDIDESGVAKKRGSSRFSVMVRQHNFPGIKIWKLLINKYVGHFLWIRLTERKCNFLNYSVNESNQK